MPMVLRLVLMLATLDAWRFGNQRRHPALADLAERWARFLMLPVLLFPLLLWPLYLFLHVARQGRMTGQDGETFHLASTQHQLMLGGIVAMIAASVVLAGFARAVTDLFGNRHWTLLAIGVASSSLLVYVLYVSSVTAALLGFTRGDNAVLTCFITVWAAAVGRVCAVPADRARDAWGLRFAARPG